MHLKALFLRIPGIRSLVVGVGTFLLQSPLAQGTPIFETVQAFVRSPEHPHAKLVEGSDGNFYGTTERGGRGARGTVFKMTPGGALTTLADFIGPDGDSPTGGLTRGKDGNFFGTTRMGGSHDMGTVFTMTPAGDLTTLASFTGANGRYPQAGLTLGRDGNFYGITSVYHRGEYWGNSDWDLPYATVFRMTPAGVLTTLANLRDGNPENGLVQGRDGNFYGTTPNGDSYGKGTVFKVTPAGVLSTLVKFTGSNGSTPVAGLEQDRDGNFYGSTTYGGRDGCGTIFKVTPNGALTTLLHFRSGNDDTITDSGIIIIAVSNEPARSPKLVKGRDGNFYGTTFGGGTWNSGMVFKMTPAGTSRVLVNFNGVNGRAPDAELVQGSDGDFYGTTSEGGKAGYGTVFKITASGALTTLVNFAARQGTHPCAELTQGTDGNFYGTTSDGGRVNCGTIFKMTASGALTTVVRFNGKNGQHPQAGLVRGPNGNFYGTTSGGKGQYSRFGTVFQMTPAGALTTLAEFDNYYHGSTPAAGLTSGSNGNLYGTTSSGGNGEGTVFKIARSGKLTTLVNFFGSDGEQPLAGLVRDRDGTFYGTTAYGGTDANFHDSYGTVFKMTPGGTLTTLVKFAGTNGRTPSAGLVQGRDGNFYGTTEQGGSSDQGGGHYGTVFKMTPGGILTTLVNFTGPNGSNPQAGLVQGSDENFYGTTSAGGLNGQGTVFQMTPAGDLTTLIDFTGDNGSRPSASLLEGRDGHLYGTTREGGTTSNGRLAGGGQIYRLLMGPTVTTQEPGPVTHSGAELNATVNPGGYQTEVIFQYGTSPALLGYSTVSASILTAGSDPLSVQANLTDLSSNTIYYYRVVASNVENSVHQTGSILSFTTPDHLNDTVTGTVSRKKP